MRKIQMFSIPYAGGTASSFSKLHSLLPEFIEMIPLEYVGHGTRVREAFYPEFSDMVEDIASQIINQRRKNMPYAIFGYSLGSLVAYEAVYEYLKQDSPVYVFIAAHFPPDYIGKSRGYWKLNDREFEDILVRFGGIDKSVMDNQRFRSIYVPPVRNDYRLLGMYEYKRHIHELLCDVSVFYCEKDTPFALMKGWSSFTEKSCEFIHIGKGHFFLKTHTEIMAERIANQLEKYL